MNKLIAGMFLTGFTFIFAGVLTLVVISGASRAPEAHAAVSAEPIIVEPVQEAVTGNSIVVTDIRQQMAEIARAEALVARAQAVVTMLQAPVALDPSLAAQLEKAQGDRDIVAKDWDLRVAAATAERDAAATEYRRVFSKFLGLELTDDRISQSPEAVLASAGIDLAALFNSALRPVTTGDLVFSTPGVGIPLAPTDDLTTPWNEALVYGWLNYFDGEILASFEDTSLPEGGINISMEMQAAWGPLDTATQTLNAVTVAQAREMTQAENRVATAQGAIQQETPQNQETLILAQADLAVAQANLDLAQVDLKVAAGS